MNLFYLIGISNTTSFVFQSKSNLAKNKNAIAYWKMDVLMASLQNKKNIAQVLTDCDLRRKQIKEKVKNI